MSNIDKVYFKDWREGLKEFLLKTKEELIIVSPYIKEGEAQYVVDILQEEGAKKCKKITTITKLEEPNLDKSLDINALKILKGFSKDSKVINFPGLHAKIYVSDKKRVIITSANLTTSAINTNHECGISIIDESADDLKSAVGQIRTNIDDSYIKSGVAIEASELDNMKLKVSRQGINVRRALDYECQHLYSKEECTNILFEKAIYYSLEYGRMKVAELQKKIKCLYPSLCIDNAHLEDARKKLANSGVIFCSGNNWQKNQWRKNKGMTKKQYKNLDGIISCRDEYKK